MDDVTQIQVFLQHNAKDVEKAQMDIKEKIENSSDDPLFIIQAIEKEMFEKGDLYDRAVRYFAFIKFFEDSFIDFKRFAPFFKNVVAQQRAKIKLGSVEKIKIKIDDMAAHPERYEYRGVISAGRSDPRRRWIQYHYGYRPDSWLVRAAFPTFDVDSYMEQSPWFAHEIAFFIRLLFRKNLLIADHSYIVAYYEYLCDSIAKQRHEINKGKERTFSWPSS